jgi:DNA-binding transcriptional MerR regulator
MTQRQFYDWLNKYYPDYDSQHWRLIKDLRDRDYTWEQITEILALMFEGPYSADWLRPSGFNDPGEQVKEPA